MGPDGEKQTIHLCGECAGKKVLDNPILKDLNLPEMLYNLTHGEGIPEEFLEKLSGKKAPPKNEKPQHICMCCGWDEQKLKKTGRMGCPACYTLFAEYVSELLSGIHKGVVHTGKCPPVIEADTKPGKKSLRKPRKNPSAVQREITLLQKELTSAVKREDYEQAAELRDKIALLKKELSAETPAKDGGGNE